MIRDTIDFVIERHASAFYSKWEIGGYKKSHFQEDRDNENRIDFLENYLKKRGYAKAMHDNQFIKGFVIVGYVKSNDGNLFESLYIQHDIQNAIPLIINESTFTGFPVALQYMEKL